MDRLSAGAQISAGVPVEPGRPWPMGARFDVDASGPGVNFAVFSAHASQIEICLFDDSGTVETARQPLPTQTGEVWHGRVPGLMPGQVYGLRAHGDRKSVV